MTPGRISGRFLLVVICGVIRQTATRELVGDNRGLNRYNIRANMRNIDNVRYNISYDTHNICTYTYNISDGRDNIATSIYNISIDTHNIGVDSHNIGNGSDNIIDKDLRENECVLVIDIAEQTS